MTKAWMRRRSLFRGTALLLASLVAAALLLGSMGHGAGLVWLGPGPGLRPQVEARLQPSGYWPEYENAESGEVASMYLQPVEPVRKWQIVRVQTANVFPWWQSVLDDDPVYSLEVDLEVEYSDGHQAHLRWSTWRYGLVLGPIVISYGDGPPGDLSRLPDVEVP
jgi:hypothetical protein